MTFFSIFTCLLPYFAATPSTLLSDSLMAPGGKANAPAQKVSTDTVVSPFWKAEFSLVLGFVAIDFPERSRFVADLADQSTAQKWVLDQPYPGSDIGPRLGFEGGLRHANSFRIALGGWYQTWSAQAIARDTLGILTNRSYGSDIWVASAGADLLISPAILRLDAGRDAHIGARYLVGMGRLSGRNSAWGPAMGASLLGGAEFVKWQNWAISAQLGVDWLTVTSQKPWSEVLTNTSSSTATSWNAGGLSLKILLRWGTSDSTLQKK